MTIILKILLYGIHVLLLTSCINTVSPVSHPTALSAPAVQKDKAETREGTTQNSHYPPFASLDTTNKQASSPQQGYSLAMLETMISQSPEVLHAMAELDGMIQARDARSAHRGASLFADTSYGLNDEPESLGADKHVSYQRWEGRVGVSLPLLGTWAKQKAALAQAESQLLTAQQRSAAKRMAALGSLRSAYIIRWQELQRRTLLEAYLKDAALVDAYLRERMNAYYLLPADYKTFQANAIQAQGQYAQSMAIETRARAVMFLATGVDVPLEQLKMPSIPRVLATQQAMEFFISQQHPEISALTTAAASLNDLPQAMALSPFDASLETAYVKTHDFPGSTGQGGSVGLRFALPFGAFSESRASRAQGEALVRQAQHAAHFRREQLLAELRIAIAEHNAALYHIINIRHRVDAALAAEKAARLRYRELAGDTFEQHVRIRHDLLAAAQNMIDAVTNVMRTQADILQAATDKGSACSSLRDAPNHIPDAMPTDSPTLLAAFSLPIDQATRARLHPAQQAELKTTISHGPFSIPQEQGTNAMQPSLNETPAATKAAPQPTIALQKILGERTLGAYVWQAAPFLSAASRSAALQKAKQLGLRRLLISFTAYELKQLRKNADSVSTLLAEAQQMGIDIYWLLGDPTWILDENRANLLEVTGLLAHLPFAGIHLDLEPDQLPAAGQQREKLARQLLTSVTAVVQSAALPVGISLHPRYLLPTGDTPWLAEQLAQAGVREIAVMAYNTAPHKLEATMTPLLQHTAALKTLNISLAQSFEKAEPKNISNYHQPYAAFLSTMRALFQQRDTPITGVLIQDWNGYLSKMDQ